MSEVLGTYKNGNYNVILFNDGTKIRMNNDTYMRADRPESIDLKISDRCNMCCPMCHEQSLPNGALADLNAPLFDTIPEWCEIALGGGNVFEHPDLDAFLFKMSYQKVICNITVHINHFIQYFNDIRYYVDHGLIHGVGVSISSPIGEAVISYLKAIPNVVVHVIAGVVPMEVLETLANNNIKLLILGYKNYGRGVAYNEKYSTEIDEGIHTLEERWDWLMESFKVVSFDNLALKQLNARNHISEEMWNKYYMGDDATATFYIDAVKMEYAASSTSKRFPIEKQNVNELFKKIRK